ncbi:hypothetical protein CEXT_405981 [Caerostris extrusa]|uniref:Uncharacterized protein n=1 Tax=Caerostris extrusa TaxID=172846 RepID=A0AAV4NVF4_CAEEX|nr:hypothetical protein CEXT_405981 [Caerostris extrusa]
MPHGSMPRTAHIEIGGKGKEKCHNNPQIQILVTNHQTGLGTEGKEILFTEKAFANLFSYAQRESSVNSLQDGCLAFQGTSKSRSKLMLFARIQFNSGKIFSFFLRIRKLFHFQASFRVQILLLQSQAQK